LSHFSHDEKQYEANAFGNRHLQQTRLDCQVFERARSKGEIGFIMTTNHHENCCAALNWGTITPAINSISLSLSLFKGKQQGAYARELSSAFASHQRGSPAQ
jgi:hypothetical protein